MYQKIKTPLIILFFFLITGPAYVALVNLCMETWRDYTLECYAASILALYGLTEELKSSRQKKI